MESESKSFTELTMKIVPHWSQRYPTVGDYFYKGDGKFEFRCSDMQNWKYHILVLVHELIEWSLIHDRDISIESIDAFDIMFEKERDAGKQPDWKEPGNDERAPYWKEHQQAEYIEKQLGHLLRIDWNEYDKMVSQLDTKPVPTDYTGPRYKFEPNSKGE